MLDKLEKIAKIISLIAIPVAIWWLGTQYQSADMKAKAAVEYVKLSISIMENQDQVDPALLEWASKTLNHYSEVKFSQPLQQAIAAGKANVSLASTTLGWFTIVGSVQSQSAAEELTLKLKDNLPSELKSLTLLTYKTDIKNLYAVTLGGETSKSEAIARATSVREAGLVPDAYAQRDRGWNKIDL